MVANSIFHGHDWGVAHKCQNVAVTFVRSLGVPSLPAIVAVSNPMGLLTALDDQDFHWRESLQIATAICASEMDWQTKANALAAH